MIVKNNNRYYFHYDQVRSLRAVTDSNGNLVKEIVYDSYGNIISDTNPNFKVPFGFAGGLYDSDAKLVHFGFREYDSAIGRWFSKDPLLFGGGDSNFYGYVLQDPVNLVYPAGEFGILGGIVAGAIGGAVVGIVDAVLNARCFSEGWRIFLFDTASGVLAGALATGGGFFGALVGELGGLGLSTLTGLNGVPNSNPCHETLSVNRLITMNRKFLHLLSVITALLFAVHFYKLDEECFFKGYILFSLILLILPFLWNKWLYEQLVKDIKNPISYITFVNIGNFVYISLFIFIIVIILTDYKPSHYVQGIC